MAGQINREGKIKVLTTKAVYLTWNVPAPQIPGSQGCFGGQITEESPVLASPLAVHCWLVQVTPADLRGPWAHTFVLIALCCACEWHDTVFVVTEVNQLTKPQELLLTGKKKEN